MTQRIALQDLIADSGVRFGTSGVRGLVSELSAEVCHAYTAAFLRAVPASSGKVALAIDLRPSSPAIAAACAGAIVNAGLELDYCGALPTPALACHAQANGLPAVMITGSHIPFERNGIKFYSAHGEITKDDETAIGNADVELPAGRLCAPLPAPNAAARRRYIDRYLDFFAAGSLRGAKLAVYQHSSVARDILCEILQGLGAETIALGRTDAFVPVDTEALSEADIRLAQQWARDVGVDAILSTDGDGDRPMLADDRGCWFRGDIVGILCAQYLGATAVGTTVSCNTAVELCHAFAQVMRTPIGSPYVIAAIDALVREGHRNVVGFEPNGGFLVGSGCEKDGRHLAPLATRDAVLPMLALLAFAREQKCPLSALAQRLPPRFTASDRLPAIATDASRRTLAELSAAPAAIDALLHGLCGKTRALDLTDGLRIRTADDEIVHFRPSGNAPELRCYAEAGTQARAEALVREALQRIRQQVERRAIDNINNR